MEVNTYCKCKQTKATKNKDFLYCWGFNNRFIKFTKDPLNSKIRYTNTEPSERRNSLEGVETRIESLKEEFLNKISIFHEPLPALSKS